MNFEHEFFEDEVRDGFFVPAEIKHAWAAELEVLSEVDRICKKYNINYYADWGTLLATVRHEGFIPWDDDLDIVMKREDYKKFLEVAPDEMLPGYLVYNYSNHDDFWLFLASFMSFHILQELIYLFLIMCLVMKRQKVKEISWHYILLHLQII